jgi:hypothetical protein
MAITIPPPYAVKVDLNNDGDYADANETLVRVMSATWRNGFQQIYDPVCRDSTATIIVDNSDGKYSPEHAGGIAGLARGKRIQITMTVDVTEYVMFTGWIDSIAPVPGQFGEQTARITATSWVNKAGHAEANVPLLADVRADVALETVVELAPCMPPGVLSSSWLLGVSGWSEIGQTSYLGTVSNYIITDTGVSVMGIIGDKWSDGVKVMAAAREVAGREFGRLFLRRDGRLEFWNRNHLPAITTSAKTYAGIMADMNYEYADVIYNQITVRAHSRRIGSAPEVLGYYNREIIVQGGSSKTITYRYADSAAGVKVAGRDIIEPISNTDFVALSGTGGTGFDVSGSITTKINRESSTSCEITFTNVGVIDAYIQVNSQVRGTKITDYGEVVVVKTNDSSIATNGVYAYVYPYAVESEAEASYMAEYLLDLYKDARGYVKSISIDAYALTTNISDIAALTIGSRITVTEPKTNASGDYFIIAEEHIVSADRASHRVKFSLEPAGIYAFWLLGTTGYGELGQTTVLGPL